MMSTLPLMNAENGRPTDSTAIRLRGPFLERRRRQGRSNEIRVVVYSHDTMGVGHMRRNLLIAAALRKRFTNVSILAIAGAREACGFSQQAGIDCLTLPAFRKMTNGCYTTRSLDIASHDVLDVRSQTILAAVQSFRPQLMIVDKVPAGAGGELLPTLEWLTGPGHGQCVLGLREILDEPAIVEREWVASNMVSVIRRYYEDIWIYGDPAVYDATIEYGFPPDLCQKTLFTGYLNTSLRLDRFDGLEQSDVSPHILCTVGGGQDGHALLNAFAAAMSDSERPCVIMCGPNASLATRDALRKSTDNHPNIQVIDFAIEGDLLIRQASHVVAMGGYNTVCAILSHRKPALLVPRTEPRREQWIRAQRLARLGWVDMVHPDAMDTRTIRDWVESSRTRSAPSRRPLDLNGLDRIAHRFQQLFPLAQARVRRGVSHVQ